MNLNRILLLPCIAIGCIAAYGQDENAIPPADQWYKTEYAPLFADKPWDKAADIASHYAETIQLHGEAIETVDALPWVTDALEEWKIQGWIRSEIADIEIDELNSTTVSFKTKWRDYFNGGNIAYECAWYLTDFINDSWKITACAEITCNEHGL